MTTPHHPFNYTYAPQRPADIAAIERAFNWTASAYGSQHPMPNIMFVNHEHMQRATSAANHQTYVVGQVYGWYSQLHRKVFVSDQIRPGRSIKEAAIVVHELVHYFQDMKKMDESIDVLENEADDYMNAFIKSLTRFSA